MKNVGFIGWRGMVGSVLMDRMVQEQILPILSSFLHHFSSRSESPVFAGKEQVSLKNAFDIDELKKLAIYRDPARVANYTK